MTQVSSSFREKLDRGELVVGTWVNAVKDPILPQILAPCGLDYLLIDAEHSGATMASISEMCMMARACGLSDCAFWLLYTLRSEEAPLTQTQLSEQLSLPKQTVNSALKKLVEEGVLRLEAADGNLKNKRVCLTEAGEAFLRRTVDRVFGVESAAAARLTEEERSALVALSQKLLDAFRAETEAFLQTAAIGD